MLLLKGWPHCHGDLVFEQDRDCSYFTCVQCGHILSTAQERALGYRATALGALHAPAGSRPVQRRAGRGGLAPEVARARANLGAALSSAW